MIYRYEDASPVEVMPGLFRRTLVTGKSMMICEFALDTGVEIPSHAHPHEQVGYVASGKVRITVGDESFVLGSGDSYYAPSGVQHGAQVLQKAVVVDTFNPPREDYRQV
jgi:quercetin dioxygenase-like cupin family protein